MSGDKDEFEDHPPIGDNDPVPRIPRGKGISFRRADLIRIAMFATLLVGVLLLARPCAEGVSSFVDTFEAPLDAAAEPEPSQELPELPPGAEYVRVGVDDDPEEVRRKIEALRNPADAGAAAGDAAPAP